MDNLSEYSFKTTRIHSDRLFSKMNFVIGMGSVMNIAGNYFQFNASPNGLEADQNAIASDLKAIASDFECAKRQLTEVE